jgi:tRNA G46 methylase TrmB
MPKTLTRTVKGMLSRVIPEPILSATRPARHFFDQQRRFDRKHGVDTSGWVGLNDLGVADTSEAGEYKGTPPRTFASILKLIPVKYSDFTFIDVGSGKGAVLLYAAGFPFKRVIGIEFAPGLHATATRNIEHFLSREKSVQCRDVKSVCMDATSYQIPAEPILFYFANPFKGKLLETMLANIANSLKESPREIVLVYYHPQSRHALYDQVAFLSRTHRLPQYSIYRNRVG